MKAIAEKSFQQMLLEDKILRIVSSVNVTNHQSITKALLELNCAKDTLRQIELVSRYHLNDYDALCLVLSALLLRPEYRAEFDFGFPFMVLRRLYEKGVFSFDDITSKIRIEKAIGFHDVLPGPSLPGEWPRMSAEWATTGIYPGSLASIIHSDDVDRLSSLSLDSYDVPCPRALYEGIESSASEINKKDWRLIDAAAFYGSVRCVRFLIMKKVSLRAAKMERAVAGGRAEIVRLCEQNGPGFEGNTKALADTAATFFRYELLDWFAEVHGVQGISINNVSTHISLTKEEFVSRHPHVFYSFPGVTRAHFYSKYPEGIRAIPSQRVSCPPEFTMELAEELLGHGIAPELLFWLCKTLADFKIAVAHADVADHFYTFQSLFWDIFPL
jgi:hypothetical protein